MQVCQGEVANSSSDCLVEAVIELEQFSPRDAGFLHGTGKIREILEMLLREACRNQTGCMALIHDKQLRPRAGGRTVRVDIIGNLVTHPGFQKKFSSVAQLCHQLTFQDKQDVTPLTPVVCQIAGGILHHAYADVPHLKGAP